MVRNCSSTPIALLALTSWLSVCLRIYLNKPNCPYWAKSYSTKYFVPFLFIRSYFVPWYLLEVYLYTTSMVYDIFPLLKLFLSTPWSKVDVGTTFSKNYLLLKTRNKNKIFGFYYHVTSFSLQKSLHLFSNWSSRKEYYLIIIEEILSEFQYNI